MSSSHYTGPYHSHYLSPWSARFNPLPVLEKVALRQVCLWVLKVFPCPYRSTSAPYSSHYFSFPLSVSFHAPYLFIHIPPTLYNVFLPVLKFPPVSISAPLLHSFIHYQCHIFLAVHSIIEQNTLHILYWS